MGSEKAVVDGAGDLVGDGVSTRGDAGGGTAGPSAAHAAIKKTANGIARDCGFITALLDG